MKKAVAFLLVAAFLVGLILPMSASAWRRHPHRHWRPRHRPPAPVVLAIPKPHPRPKGWCARHPKKCNRVVDTKKEACWDINNDGFIDDREKAGMAKHPGKCPSS